MFEKQKLFILGMARSGYEVAKLLADRGNKITINDKNSNQDINCVNELKKKGVKILLGEHPDNLFNQDYDYLIKNPGIPNNHKYVIKAKQLNIPVINEMEVAYQLMPKDVKIVGVTGSNGKTTTTILIYELLKKANNVKATQMALSSFSQPIVLLLGGLDRDHSFLDLKEYMKQVKLVIAYGETKERIKTFVDSLDIQCKIAVNLEKAVQEAYQLSKEGDIILLSPACASWDQFKDFEERGKMFKNYINNLKQKEEL